MPHRSPVSVRWAAGPQRSLSWMLALGLVACGHGGAGAAVDDSDGDTDASSTAATHGEGSTVDATGVGEGSDATTMTTTVAEGSSGGSGDDSGGKGPPPQRCADPVQALPADAPTLQPGVWVDLTPPGLPKDDPEGMIAQGLTMDPCNPAVLYWGTTPFDDARGGMYRTTNAGATWELLGDAAADADPWDTSATFLDMPLHIRVDPEDPQHVYAGDGVRGGTLGFWISHDGAQTWTKPQALVDLAMERGLFLDDIYDVAIDPTDFDHVLLSSHSAWAFDSPEYGQAAGVLETKDGGESWIAHDPELSWGAGHSIDFLYAPELGIGDADTWLLGTQGDGYWRTDDGGASWTQVSTTSIFHGGGDRYYAPDGVLYASGSPQSLRSTDNGVTFEAITTGGTTCVFGDGETLYTAPAYGFGEQPFSTSAIDDGVNWTPGTQLLGSGPFEMAFDPYNRIVYASMWFSGVWALQLDD